MTHFVVVWKYTDDAEMITRNASAHKAYLQEQVSKGHVKAAGPAEDGKGGVLILEAEGQSELHRLLDGDPYLSEGVVVESHVYPFKAVLGAFASG